MSSSHHYPLIPKLLFLLAGAFILGGQAGKLHSWQKSQAASASLLVGDSVSKRRENALSGMPRSTILASIMPTMLKIPMKKKSPSLLMPDTKTETLHVSSMH